ncbi:sigma-54-dependent transcriptional regulator [Sphingomonas mollis]|uniref:Sigma-54-dependent Fis family transcriptional regulator n=1 Tax=Sphingomonas mollis TaxID=2795726 RepID=A0ABS0XPU0_9SPHN|nr:sigma 54-interacting transcriptional regulator [Sphingomonas sp. BT553]MBJ6122067.1 sigma-54-dependent Fis family transcriptional regulator [Sphingomonas sp. BT553]
MHVDITAETRLLLIGMPGGELRLAATMAREAGAEVIMADQPDAALNILRGASVGLVMIDVMADVAGFVAQLRRERFVVPVIACGIDAPAERAVAAIRGGARDYVPLPSDRMMIAAALAIAATPPATRVVGNHPAFLKAIDYAGAIAPGSLPVSIVGETGTGRALLARAIHVASGRSGPFLAVECNGTASVMVEAELFGHRPGDLAGVPTGRLGKLDEARGGTLFVRDIDRLAPETQGRLMLALMDDRAGFRLIVSSACDLATLVPTGDFRADLAARQSTARIDLPPLRDRAGDIALLAPHLAERTARIEGGAVRPVDAAAVALLGDYPWPGNVRELEDVMRRAVILARGPAIGREDLVLVDGTRMLAIARPQEAGVDGLVGRTVEDVERALILRTLERCRGNRTSASGILGISVRTMRNKLRIFVEAGIPVAPAA